MFYRRKILLSLLQVFDGQLEKISLQKLLFLLSENQTVKSYHFVPYKFGCYSFQANADLHTLEKYGLVKESENLWEKLDIKDYLEELKPEDKASVRFVRNQYGALSKDELIELTYKTYPFFAINSTIAGRILGEEELETVKKLKPTNTEIVLYTIGYEGLSLDEYLNKLILNDVRVLCDVRKNSFSMKYGFSKNQLEKACERVGIEYVHIPEVGIDSDKRQNLNTQADYDTLFAYYRLNVLRNEPEKQKGIFQLLKNKKRIALTCFEANIHQCHRKQLAESIAAMDGFAYKIIHI
ncbi:MAG: DUF488 domain-containing protein [Lentimicrobiaceae bacterium]|nr:DUF488 domain-containing protein [Lentimicrobiaceae bacterium]